jgi:hypothetical protein
MSVELPSNLQTLTDSQLYEHLIAIYQWEGPNQAKRRLVEDELKERGKDEWLKTAQEYLPR